MRFLQDPDDAQRAEDERGKRSELMRKERAAVSKYIITPPFIGVAAQTRHTQSSLS